MQGCQVTDAQQIPLVELLDSVPQGAVFVQTENKVPFPASTSHPVGRLCREASERIKALEVQVEALRRALHEVAEEWAGSECGVPVYAQEAYAIGLAKRMYQLAVEAMKGQS